MSAYPEFNLLPPPPPTYLSTSSPRRAQLPRFANVDEVVDFARGQVLARRSLPIEVSLFFVVIYIGLLGIGSFSVIIQRIISGKFWVFRIVRRPDGRLLVPHLHNCWSVMAGGFACLWIAYKIAYLVDIAHQQPPRHACFGLIYVWGPLYVGVSWMAWAAAVAGTQNLFVRIKITRRWEKKFWVRPCAANFLGIVVPCSCALAVFFPARLGNQHSEAARRLFIEWNNRFSTHQDITEEMLVQLQLIWFQTIQHANYFAIAAMMWSIFALISNLVYLHFSLRLIRTLRTHLRMGGPKAGPIQNAMTMSMGIFSGETAPNREEEQLDQRVQYRTAVQSFGGTSATASSNIVRSQVAITIEDARSPCEEKEPIAGLSPPSPVLPPSKPMILPACAHREGSSSVTRAVLYFIIQSASLNLGTFFFLTVMFVSGIVTVAQTEQGHFLNTINTCQMLLAFICVVFGTTTLLSIAHETYEESLASLIHPPRKTHTDSVPFKLSPVTISVLERQRRVPQEIQTHEVQMELYIQTDDRWPVVERQEACFDQQERLGP
ncbi:unnamed protein product [Tilletia controversa]|uniref:Uncharacterized protein n=1 Tax=Tilletia controversa TaxID=13291 RepID=A0A8X7SY68_9BASI|nr:hypothetical protein CF328_g2591 [Tilletia controversa]KAE8251043.1 hypothetical protein A4X06_0g2833 [Tilletia controversa]CAD6900773.1 unnamed protein product [Tilletia controversa]CAD6902906.1 unnamed protein product [Tilletia controversa]CAD6970183.1 unnamed protein product [Tilletia controversa]